ncbi:MAG: hypothetical protein DRN08_05480, partial [Thermoplasmata archaeon]
LATDVAEKGKWSIEDTIKLVRTIAPYMNLSDLREKLRAIIDKNLDDLPPICKKYPNVEEIFTINKIYNLLRDKNYGREILKNFLENGEVPDNIALHGISLTKAETIEISAGENLPIIINLLGILEDKALKSGSMVRERYETEVSIVQAFGEGIYIGRNLEIPLKFAEKGGALAIINTKDLINDFRNLDITDNIGDGKTSLVIHDREWNPIKLPLKYVEKIYVKPELYRYSRIYWRRAISNLSKEKGISYGEAERELSERTFGRGRRLSDVVECIYLGPFEMGEVEKAKLPEIEERKKRIERSRRDVYDIISNLDKLEYREKLAEVLAKTYPPVKASDFEGCRLVETAEKVEEIYGVEVGLGTIMVPPKKWCVYYGVTKDGVEVPIFLNRDVLEREFQRRYGHNLETGIENGEEIRIRGIDLVVKKGEGLVSKLRRTPTIGGTFIEPGELVQPFNRTGLRLAVEVPGEELNYHEDLHAAYRLHKYLQGRYSPRRRLSVEQRIIDEISAHRENVRVKRMTWSDVTFNLTYLYMSSYIVEYALTSRKAESLNKKIKEVIAVVKELEESGVSQHRISEILFNNDTLKDVIKAGNKEIKRLKRRERKGHSLSIIIERLKKVKGIGRRLVVDLNAPATDRDFDRLNRRIVREARIAARRYKTLEHKILDAIGYHSYYTFKKEHEGAKKGELIDYQHRFIDRIWNLPVDKEDVERFENRIRKKIRRLANRRRFRRYGITEEDILSYLNFSDVKRSLESAKKEDLVDAEYRLVSNIHNLKVDRDGRLGIKRRWWLITNPDAPATDRDFERMHESIVSEAERLARRYQIEDEVDERGNVIKYGFEKILDRIG